MFFFQDIYIIYGLRFVAINRSYWLPFLSRGWYYWALSLGCWGFSLWLVGDGDESMKIMYYSPPGRRSSINSIPRDPITLSEDDGGVQSPPQQSVYVPWPFSEGDCFFLGNRNRCEWLRLTDETELIFEQSLFGLSNRWCWQFFLWR